MVYYNLTNIKAELGITDASLDTVLNLYGVESDDYVNARLSPYFNTPISSPDNNIINASNYGAIARFYNARIIASDQDTVAKAPAYFQRADIFIDTYLDSVKRTKTATKTPQYFVATSGNFMNTNNTMG